MISAMQSQHPLQHSKQTNPMRQSLAVDHPQIIKLVSYVT